MATKDTNENFEGSSHASDAGKNTDASTKTVEAWAGDLNTPDWMFAAAKAYANWPHGRETTKSDFEKALEAVDGIVCR